MHKLLVTLTKPILLTTLILLSVASSYASTTNYSYDEYSYLKEAQYEEQATIAYEYDSIGNRLSRAVTVISTELSIEVRTDSGTKLSNLQVYAFSDSGTYTGTVSTTDETGKAIFNPEDFKQGNYKFRVDYLGSSFWSEVTSLPAFRKLQLIIEEEKVAISVTVEGSSGEGLKVYLFTETGSYLNLYGVADSNGKVYFNLPSGSTFKFRADYLGSQYWSDPVEVVAGSETENLVELAISGGTLYVTFSKGENDPLAGYKLYLFSSSGSYLSQSATSDENGQAAFHVSNGEYKVRADLLGYQFWTDPVTVDEDQYYDFTLPHKDMRLTVVGDFNGDLKPKEGIKSYLFSPIDTYLGIQKETDSNGMALFNLPEQEYKIRSDYLSMKFWTEPFTWTDEVISIEEGMADITVTNLGFQLKGVKVYLFSDTGSYLGISATTDENGKVTFRLPQGTYNFRADYMGSQYWSGASAIVAHISNPIEVSTGGGNFSLTVLKDSTTPMENLTCYLFSGQGTYLSEKNATNEHGVADFNLADGTYKFRIDYMGYQFWTETYSVPDTLTATLTIPHQDVSITVNKVYETLSYPIESCKVYLFKEGGSYLGLSGETGEQGQISFNLPSQPYQARVDYLNQQYWSASLIWSDQVVNISHGLVKLHITHDEADVQNVNVYLFSETGSYLGQSAQSDISGNAEFVIPEGIYNLRVDYNGTQYWSGETEVIADEETTMEVEVD